MARRFPIERNFLHDIPCPTCLAQERKGQDSRVWFSFFTFFFTFRKVFLHTETEVITSLLRFFSERFIGSEQHMRFGGGWIILNLSPLGELWGFLFFEAFSLGYYFRISRCGVLSFFASLTRNSWTLLAFSNTAYVIIFLIASALTLVYHILVLVDRHSSAFNDISFRPAAHCPGSVFLRYTSRPT